MTDLYPWKRATVNLLSLSVGSSGSGPSGDDPQVCMDRLLALETPEDAALIREALEPGWEDDWAAAFNRAAHKVLG